MPLLLTTPAPHPLLLATDPTVFTWVDAVKIIAIPLIFLLLTRILNRREKTTDEVKAQKAAEAKAREKRVDDDLRTLKEALGQFEDKDLLRSQHEKTQASLNNHENRLSGFQQAIERLADATDQRIKNVESQMGDVRQMRDDVAGMKAKIDVFAENFRHVNEKLDRLLHSLIK